MDSEAAVRPDPDSEVQGNPTVEVIEEGAGAVISGVDDARLADIGVELYATLGGIELSPEERVLMLHAGEPLRPNGMWIRLEDGRLTVSAWNRRDETEKCELVQRVVRERCG